MAVSRAAATLLLLFNLVFFTMVSVADVACPPPPAVPKPHTGGHDHGHGPSGKCTINTLKLRVCANLLGDLLHLGLVVETKPKTTPCCPLIHGLADLDAAVCLCTAIKANLLGINLDAPVSLSLILNNCANKLPSGFQC